MTLSVIIPAYNEKNFIAELLRRVGDSPLADYMVIIDDASTDGTRQFLEDLQRRQANGERSLELEGGGQLRIDRMQFLFQDHNQGKGAALRRGFKEATGDVLLVQDADLEYDPKEYPKLAAPMSSMARGSWVARSACTYSGTTLGTSF